MDGKTKIALEGSIDHWVENKAVTNPDGAKFGSIDCALCDLFIVHKGGSCIGCPVSYLTGKTACSGSPYAAAVHARSGWYRAIDYGEDETAAKKAYKAACADEIEFLKSLRETT